MALPRVCWALSIAQGGIELISWLRPTHLPRESVIAINPLVALVAIGLSIAAAVACSLVPVTGVWREPDHRDLATRAPVSAGGARRLQRALVVAEVALSIVPLVAAGLMLRSFANLNNAPLGFDATNVLTARVPFSLRQFSDPESRLRLQRDAVAAVKRSPASRRRARCIRCRSRLRRSACASGATRAARMKASSRCSR